MHLPQWRGKNRGTTVLAALVLVAILGVVAAVLQYAGHPSQFASAPEAQTAATEPAASDSSQDTANQTESQACTNEKNAAAARGYDDTSGQTADKTGTNLDDNCVAAVLDMSKPQPIDPTKATSYECVGKSARVGVNGSTITENYAPDPSVPAGTCKTVACNASGQCFAASNLNGLTASAVTAGLAPNASSLPQASDFTQFQTSNGNVVAGGLSSDQLNTLSNSLSTYGNAPITPSSLTSSTPSPLPSDLISAMAGTPASGNLVPGGGTTLTPPPAPVNKNSDLGNTTNLTAQGGVLTQPPAPLNPNLGNTGSGTTIPPATYTGTPNIPATAANNSSNSLNNLMQEMMLMNMIKSLSGQTTPGTAPAGNQTPYPSGSCNTQYLCSGNQVYYEQNTCVQTPYQTCQNGCDPGGTTCAAPSPYGVGTNGQACTAPVAQPDPSTCTTGTWMPLASNGCQNASWQCVPGSGTGSSAQPIAQLSCSPQVADVGMSVAISYGCQNATSATGGGFTTQGTSGSATASISTPPTGSNTATYTLSCINGAQTAGAQCAVQINQPSIVLVANPSSVPSGSSTSIGWVTAGMQSCTVSASPDLGGFNESNAADTSPSGVATLSGITSAESVTLTCQTLGGGTKTASTMVNVGSGSATSSQPVSVSSSADGASISHGSPVTVTWNTSSPPSGSAMSLWFVDLQTQSANALIAGAQPTSGSYTWNVPAVGATCNANAANVCASDLVAGDSYSVEAILYTPNNAYVGDGTAPANPVQPSYGASAVGGSFTVSQ